MKGSVLTMKFLFLFTLFVVEEHRYFSDDILTLVPGPEKATPEGLERQQVGVTI